MNRENIIKIREMSNEEFKRQVQALNDIFSDDYSNLGRVVVDEIIHRFFDADICEKCSSFLDFNECANIDCDKTYCNCDSYKYCSLACRIEDEERDNEYGN